MTTTLRKHFIRWSVLTGTVAVLLAMTLWSLSQPLGDFANYYFASAFLLEGNFGEWVYDPYSFNMAIADLGYTGLFLNYTPVPPVTALFYVPFVWFPPEVAKLLFNLSGVALFLFSSYRLFTYLGIDKRFLLILPFLFFLPVKSNIDQGQAYFFMFSLITEGYLNYRQNRYWGSALLWSVAIVLKVFPAIVLLFLLTERDYKQAGRTVLAAALLIVVSLPLVSWPVWETYMIDILPRLMAGEINDPFSSTYQSMSVLLRKLFMTDAALNPVPLIVNEPTFYLLDTAWKLLLLYLGWTTARTMHHRFLSLAWFLFLALLVSGYGSTYGMLFALPLCVAMWKEERRCAVLCTILLALAVNIPVGMLQAMPLLAQFPRLYLLVAVFVGLMIHVNAPVRVIPVVFTLLIALVVGYVKIPRQEPSRVIPAPGGALLTYGYRLEKDGMEVLIYDQRGPSSAFVKIPVNVSGEGQRVELQDNQLFYRDVQLTFGNDRKKQPVLLETGEVMYLSDRRRGVGFYALRILNPETIME